MSCECLHKILKQGRIFRFNNNVEDMPKNGVYVLYETGELGHGEDRIVRIGTDTGENQLRSRIFQHFINENKNRSIFRKNIGRAMLNKQQNPYLTIWNYDTTTREQKQKYSHLVDKPFEQNLEREISIYMQENFYFRLLSVEGKENRLNLEKAMIGTVSNCKDCKPSPNWLGNYSPINKIRESGLWLVQGLYKNELNDENMDFIKNALIK